MFAVESYTIASLLFPRLLGFIFFFAIGAFIFQIKGLLGANGILPAGSFLNAVWMRYHRKSYLYLPTLFWFNSSNAALFGIISLGVACSILLMCGIYPSIMLFLLYIIYLSIVSIGQDFLSFGWEGFLLEITVHAFLLSLTSSPNILIWTSTNLLLFRFHFQAGAVKLQSRDRSWRDLTAVGYHYESQPLPNTIAWYAHKLPMSFQKFSTLYMFFVELIIPFGIFGNETLRFYVFCAFASLQLFIWLTGNFSFLNHLTMIFCVILLSNHYLSFLISPPALYPTAIWLEVILSCIGGVLLFLQGIRLANHFMPTLFYERIFRAIAPFYLANRYGIFAVMTTTRYEIVIEGSDNNLDWKEYLFRYKSSEITRRPRRISPFQPRLDWQVWFLPFTEFHSEQWFQSFIYHLLLGTPEVLKLLRYNPFSNKPPKYIRVLLYVYEFSSFEEKKSRGWWWRRTLVENYSPTLSLK